MCVTCEDRSIYIHKDDEEYEKAEKKAIEDSRLDPLAYADSEAQYGKENVIVKQGPRPKRSPYVSMRGPRPKRSPQVVVRIYLFSIASIASVPKYATRCNALFETFFSKVKCPLNNDNLILLNF